MMLIPRLGTELIPQLSQGEFNVDFRLSPGAPLVETDRSILAIQAATSDMENVELSYSVAGTGNRLDANPVDSGENTGTLSLTLRPGAGSRGGIGCYGLDSRRVRTLPGVQYRIQPPRPDEFCESVADRDCRLRPRRPGACQCRRIEAS